MNPMQQVKIGKVTLNIGAGKDPAKLEKGLVLIKAKENNLAERNFDTNGNISFGIQEYIDIPGVAYDPKIGVIGLEVCVTLEKNGYRIKNRKIKQKKLPKKHTVTKEEAKEFMKKQF